MRVDTSQGPGARRCWCQNCGLSARHWIGAASPKVCCCKDSWENGYSLLWDQKTLQITMYVCVLSRLSCVWLFETLWMVAHQASLSMGFSRQEYWNGWPCSSRGDLPDPGIEPTSLMSLALVGRFFPTSATWEACKLPYIPKYNLGKNSFTALLGQRGHSRLVFWKTICSNSGGSGEELYSNGSRAMLLIRIRVCAGPACL